jgi:hypothetical protein
MEAIDRKIDALESEVLALRAEAKAKAAAPAAVAPANATGGGGDAKPAWDDPATVAKIREKWRASLAATEKLLWQAYPAGQPDARGDVVAWSRFDDLRKAKDAFERATDAASLRALSEGEFRFYFRWEP